jgi:hypothetical protein
MRPLSVAIVRAGLIPDDALGELKRWGLPVEFVTEKEPLQTPEAVANVIMDALESEDQVRMRDTDFDVLKRYLDPANTIQAKLHLDNGEGEKSTAKIRVCKTRMNDFAIPWRGETISDLLTNGHTYLSYEEGEDGPGDGIIKVKHKIFFSDVEEMYLGEHKAFMICKVATNGTR